MATVTFSQRIDMDTFAVWNGNVIEATSSRIVLSDGFRTAYYTGSFGFTGSEVTSGTLTGVSEVDGSVTAFRATGINVPAPTAYSLVSSNDLPTLFSLALAN